MTTDITLKSGDTLANLADEYLNDYQQWREIAYVNGLNIFQALPTGEVLKLPDKEQLRRSIDQEKARVIASATREVQEILGEITSSREAKSLAKVLGVDTTQLLKDLDLSALAKALPPTEQATEQVWQLLQWVL